ncbi:aminopeptidase N [Stella humosa]|uniref:Aminopeptidase N n=1 Tax=Stella humosa TaxID=94 RepID=A0A3N1KX98_9PROT|nr:aminopeptidase N [Stella humosa]ROP83847.1 aminopeptidase N [Stella humosa]BBK32892.1 aminopeptidase N [Stella humosa]
MSHQPIRRADYLPPDFGIDRVELEFDLEPARTLVRARLAIRRIGASDAALVLDGEDMELLGLALDGNALAADRYRLEPTRLTIPGVPDAFELVIDGAIAPAANTALEGLYISSSVFCTQCEPEGFRRITWFLDRPDVLSVFRTTIRAERARFPILLSNGNLAAARDLGDGRHEAVWDDPFPKPSYLFALVAGDLAVVEDRFTTRSGRDVALKILVEHGKEGRAGYAMDSLKRSMRWDEETYGLEYDLDVFHIVAVSDFNMGAMENKSLNVFNDRFILADPATATDLDYANVEGVVAHEYFHNWTGNRITCRDWFQLSLKEGLTVYRDQEFTADERSRAVKRIQDVRVLRARQFPEDGGPLAHPIRPDSYLEINNFYTATVYEKGAEVIRMLEALLDRDGFRRGMDLYVARHDGEAATCDQFVAAMADANGRDLSHFLRWYGQAGTPRLTLEQSHDAATGTYALTVSQRTPPTPGQPDKLPLHLPVHMGLIGRDGAEIPLRLEGENAPQGTSRVLELTEASQTWRFVGVEAPPVLSINRGFAAPVVVESSESEDDLALRMRADADPFSRWEAAQSFATRLLLAGIAAAAEGRPPPPTDAFVAALAAAFDAVEGDPAFAAELLALPGELYLAEQVAVIDVEAIHAARKALRAAVAQGLVDRLRHVRTGPPRPFAPDAASAGHRALANMALGYLSTIDGPAAAMAQYRAADNMTDRFSALAILSELDVPERTAALADFHDRHAGDALVLNKWLGLQAGSSLPDTLATVRALLDHPAFSYGNPNKIYALVGGFAGNALRFHAADGSGYAFMVDQILRLDPQNPQVASRLLKAFGRWRRFDADRQALMRDAMERIAATPGLSPDCREIVGLSLAS